MGSRKGTGHGAMLGQNSNNSCEPHLQFKNKTMSNITIIDKISERQQRMEEKYFGQNAKKLLQQNTKCQSEY